MTRQVGERKSSRIIGIDVARSCAILLAMGSHVWVADRMERFFSGPSVDFIRLLMALATPTFIILFGTMLEIVYRPRFVGDERLKITARLWSRAVQCWLLYAASVFVLYIVRDDYSAGFSLSTIMFLGVTPFTDILKFYTVTLALAPLLLIARNRFGLMPLVLLAAGLHLCYPLLHATPDPQGLGLPLEISRIMMFLFGVGTTPMGGPSVLHGVTLVIAGLVLAKLLVGPPLLKTGQLASLPMRAACIFGLGIIPLVIGYGLADGKLIQGLGDMTLRMESHPLYFLAGILGAYALTGAAILLTSRLQASSVNSLSQAVFFGRTSLFTFAFGNMLLYLTTYDPETRLQCGILAIILMAAIALMSFWFDRQIRAKAGWVAKATTTIQEPINWCTRTALSIGQSALTTRQSS